MNPIEIVGIIASLFVVISMCFKTTLFKGTIIMRSINGVGCIVFIVYGALLPAIATLITNICAFIINIFYLVKEVRDHYKNNK